MGNLARDVRLAVRGLRRNPALASVALATLALGIGVNVAMFSVLHAVVLKPLPYPEPDRLVVVWPTKTLNKAMVDEVSERTSAFSAVAGVSQWSFDLLDGDQPEQLTTLVVGIDYFDILGVRPVTGRAFLPEERDPGRSDVAILSWDLWQRRFGGDPEVVGRTLHVEGYDHASRRVVGILPRGFASPREGIDLWVPLHQPAGKTVANDSSYYVNRTLARLAPGVTHERASEEVRAFAEALRRDHPGLVSAESVASAGTVPLHEQLVGETGRTLWLMLGAVGLVLLIACANLANLLLARAGERARDVALRSALGAGRGRLVQQHLTESAVLALAGGLLGVAVAAGTLEALTAGLATRIPRGATVSMDLTVLAYALGISIAGGLLFGIAPALRAAGRDAADSLRGSGRGTAGLARHRLNRALVASEIALAVVVAASAGLVVRSFLALRSTDPGFRTEGITAVQVSAPQGRYSANEDQRVYYRQVLERVRAAPGVGRVGGIHLMPLTFNNWSFPYLAEGQTPSADQPLPSANFRIVLGDYFAVMGIPLLRGRGFTAEDVPEGPRSIVVNRRLAELVWPGQDPIGKELRVFGNMEHRVVGVVGDVIQHRATIPVQPEMYVTHQQFPTGEMNLVIEPAEDGPDPIPSIRDVIWSVDPQVPIPSVTPLERVVSDAVSEARFLSQLFAGFGLLALLLGSVGVFGVMSYVTQARVPEWGVRLALGAKPERVLRSALAGAFAPLLLGLVLGIAGSVAAGRLLQGLLYEIEPNDPLTLAAVTAILGGITVLATWLPARRAARVDPVSVLRAE